MLENNEEVADFIKDLDAWKAQMEAQDTHLRHQEPKAKDLPAIRNTLYKKQRKKKLNSAPPPTKSAARISGYDYRAWDRFDYDKALEAVDNRPLPPSDASSSETDEELENRRRIALASEVRELGNQRFKEKQYEEAVEHYTTAIRLAPEDPTPLTNRALVHLKLEQYASAEADCSAALVLDNKNTKALFRRAIARKHLGKRSEAIQDLKSLLKSNPSNKSAAVELASIVGPTEAITNPEHISPPVETPPRQLNPPSEHRKFKRVTIVEVGGTNPDSTVTTTERAGVVEVASHRVPSFNGSTRESIVSDRLPGTTCSHQGSGDKENRPSRTTPLTPAITLAPNGPDNWFQLERELRELNSLEPQSTLADAGIAYLCRICPTRYAKVIGSNLEATFLTQLLHAFSKSNSLSPTDLAIRLDHLARLPRFDVAWLLVDDIGKHVFQELCDRLQNDSHICKDQLERIKRAFI